MTAHAHRRHELSRLAIAGAFLLAGLAGSGLAASAGPPVVDDGGSGGGGATSSDRPIFLEHFGLVATNDGPGSFSMNPEPDGPSLVGSGPEREIVADADKVPVLVGSGPEREIVANADEVPVLVGSGPERETVADSEELPTIAGPSPDMVLAMNTESQQSAGTLDEAARANDLIAMSGGTVAAGTLDETARSQSLIASSATEIVDTAAARGGHPY